MALINVLWRSDTDPIWAEQPLAVGSVIVPNTGGAIPSLKSPGVSEGEFKTWGYAIVIQVSPLICASDLGDMRWANFDISKFTIVGKANADALATAMQRLAS
jgi:hypothetical protein